MSRIGLLALFLLASCSSASYTKTFKDGTTLEASAFEFGTDKQLTGLTYKSEGVEISLESLDSNQTKGLAAVSEGVARGVVKALKP